MTDTRRQLAVVGDADQPSRRRVRAALELAAEHAEVSDDAKTMLVHLLNEPDRELVAAVFTLLQRVDHWIVVGVRHGLLVRCESSVSEQMPMTTASPTPTSAKSSTSKTSPCWCRGWRRLRRGWSIGGARVRNVCASDVVDGGLVLAGPPL